MITVEMIEIFNSFGGDSDGYARTGTKEQKLIITDHDWSFIESVLQDIHLVKNGLASESFSRSLELTLKENCDSEETIELLKDIALK